MAGLQTGTSNLHLPGLHPYLPRSETNAVMSRYLTEDGWYLLRPSFTNQGLFSICVTFGGSVKHFKILQDEGTLEYFVSSRRFPTIMDLLFCYKTVPLKSKNCQVFLLNSIPVDREKEREHMIQQGIHLAPTKSPSNQMTSRPLPLPPGKSNANTIPRGRPLPEVPQPARNESFKDKTRRGTWGSPSNSERSRRPQGHREKEKGSLPTGWTEHFSQQHKRPYYYNASTKETTWKKPPASPVLAASMPTVGEDVNYVTMQTSIHCQTQPKRIGNGRPPMLPPKQESLELQKWIPEVDRAPPPVPRRNQSSSQQVEEIQPRSKPAYEEMKLPHSLGDQGRRQTAPEVVGILPPQVQTMGHGDQGRRQTVPEVVGTLPQTMGPNVIAKSTPPPPLPVRSSPGNVLRGIPVAEMQNEQPPAPMRGRDNAPPPLPARPDSGPSLPSRGSRDPSYLPPSRDAPPPIPGRNDMPQKRLVSRAENTTTLIPNRAETPLPPPPVPGRGEQAVPPLPSRCDPPAAPPVAPPVLTNPPPLPRRAAAAPAAPPPLPGREETQPPRIPTRQDSVRNSPPTLPRHEYVNDRGLAPLPPTPQDGSRRPPPLPLKDESPAISNGTYPSTLALVPPPPPQVSSSPMMGAYAPLPPPPPPPDLPAPPPPDEIPPSPRISKQRSPTTPVSMPPNFGASSLLDEIKAFGGGSTGRLRPASQRETSTGEFQVAASEGDIISALRNRLMIVNVAARQDESDEEFEQVEDDEEWN